MNDEKWLRVVVSLVVLAVVTAVALFMLLGAVIGINLYKGQCEPMSLNRYQIEWLECEP